jgi:hypothetical protein
MRRNSPYPDISDILAQKMVGQRKRGQISFAEKLDILDALRERVAPIAQARAGRKTRRSSAQA